MQSKDVAIMSDNDEEMPIWIHWPGAIITTIVGCIFIIIILTSTIKQLSTSEWATTTGIIDDYDFFCNYDGEGDCVLEEDIVYTYTIEGINYTNDDTNIGWTKIEFQWYMSLGLTNGVTFEDGDEIVVYYDPYDPQKSVLIPGEDGIDIFDYVVVVLALIIPLISLITARRKGTISDAINEFKGMAQTAKEMQRKMEESGIGMMGGGQIHASHYDSASNSEYGISPSRMRGYKSAIAYLSLNDSMNENTVKALVQSNFGISENDARKFVESPYVKSILFSNSPENGGRITPYISPTPSSEPRPENLIGEDDNASQELQSQLISNFQDAFQEAIEDQVNSERSTISNNPNSEKCSHPNCNNEVAFYSFQCFSCRKKFCDEHKGTSIHCADCS